MKKLRLRKWIKYYLIIVNCFLILVLVGDMENIIAFTIKNIIGIVLFLFNNYILFKYSDLFKEN